MAKQTRSQRKNTKAQIEREIEFFLSHSGRPGSPLRRRRGVHRFEPIVTPIGIRVVDNKTIKDAVKILSRRHPREDVGYILSQARLFMLGGHGRRTVGDIVKRYEELESV